MQDNTFSRQFVFTLQLIHVALAVGVLLFGVVTIIVFALDPATSSETSSSSVKLLTLVHALMALTLFPVGFFVFYAVLDKGGDSLKLSARIQAAYLVRAALWEGAALFGLVVLFLAGKSTLSAEPIFIVNVISPLLFLVFVAMTFPTRERLVQLVRSGRPT